MRLMKLSRLRDFRYLLSIIFIKKIADHADRKWIPSKRNDYSDFFYKSFDIILKFIINQLKYLRKIAFAIASTVCEWLDSRAANWSVNYFSLSLFNLLLFCSSVLSWLIFVDYVYQSNYLHASVHHYHQLASNFVLFSTQSIFRLRLRSQSKSNQMQ